MTEGIQQRRDRSQDIPQNKQLSCENERSIKI